MKTVQYKYITEYDEMEQKMNDVLHRDFNVCSQEPTPINVNLCLYSINNRCFIEGTHENTQNDFMDIPKSFQLTYPFLQFLVEDKKDSTVGFPTFQYNCIISTGENETKIPKTQQHIQFETECFRAFSKIISEIHDVKNIYSSYRGFLYNEPEENGAKTEPITVTAFFDITYLRYNPEFGSPYIWSIVDEIINKKKVLELGVLPSSTEILKQNVIARTIYSIKDNAYPYPYQLYLCKRKNGANSIEIGDYENVKKGEPELFLEHDILPTAFYFTTYPLEGETDIDNLVRYAVYIVKGYYMIEKDIASFIEEKDNLKEIQEKTLMASTIYFHEKGVQMWAVKNILHFTPI